MSPEPPVPVAILISGRGTNMVALLRAAALLAEGVALDDLERELILAALARAGGNKAAAARLLGVTRRRLYSLLASHGLPGAGDAL